MSKIKCYRDLEIWKKGVNIVKDVYRDTQTFPKEESYGLTHQMRKAAVSIPSNIAEGFRRQHNPEFRQFLYIALGSCAELETQMILSAELGFIPASRQEEFLERSELLCKMIMSLINKL